VVGQSDAGGHLGKDNRGRKWFHRDDFFGTWVPLGGCERSEMGKGAKRSKISGGVVGWRSWGVMLHSFHPTYPSLYDFYEG
jgi:hypothetical protein